MAAVVREKGEVVELSNGNDTKNLIEGESIGLREMAESNSTALRNNSNQLNFPSSSLTPLSSREPSPRRRPTPRSASPTQQYSIRMSLSPRTNSVYEESPDTTLSSTALEAMGDGGAQSKSQFATASEELELDYGESEDGMELGTGSSKEEFIEDRTRGDEVECKSQNGDEGRRSSSPRLRQSPSSYIASPWQRRRSLSSPRPRSPSPVSYTHFAPSPSLAPHSAFSSPNVSRMLSPARLTPTSSAAPEMIRLHICLPRGLPASSLSHYLNTISPPFEIYEQTLNTSQPAAMGFIIVEKELWDNGEIEARVKRRGDMQFGFGGKWTWSMKLKVAKDQLFSSKRLYEQAQERRAERERERRAQGWVGMVLEGFGRETDESFVGGLLERFLWFWEDLRVVKGEGTEGVRVMFEVKGQKAARVVEKDFDGALIEGRRIIVRRLSNMWDGRYAEIEGVKENGRGRREFSEIRGRSSSRSRSRSRLHDYRYSSRRSITNGSDLRRSRYEDQVENNWSSESKRRNESTRYEITHRRQDSRSRSPRRRIHRSLSPSYSSRTRYRSRSPDLSSRQSRSDRFSSHPRHQSSQYEPPQVLPSRGYSRSRSPRRNDFASSSRRNQDSPPRYASPDPKTRPDPSHWRQDTPILRLSPTTNRVPLPRPPTPTQPRAFEDRKRNRDFAGSGLYQDQQRRRRNEGWSDKRKGGYVGYN